MPELEHMPVTFAAGSTGSRVDAGEGTAGGSLELVKQLAVRARDPAGLVPHSPPVGRISVQVLLGCAALGLLAGGTGVSHLTDAFTIITIAFTTTAIAILWA